MGDPRWPVWIDLVDRRTEHGTGAVERRVAVAGQLLLCEYRFPDVWWDAETVEGLAGLGEVALVWQRDPPQGIGTRRPRRREDGVERLVELSDLGREVPLLRVLGEPGASAGHRGMRACAMMAP